MIYASRLFGRIARFQSGISLPALQGLQQRTCMATAPASKSDIREEEFWKKNERLKRPMSPHMTIYQLQITSVLSLTHRTTGIVLAGGLYSFALGALVMPGTFPQCVAALQAMHLNPALVFTLKLVAAWSFYYHLNNGIRHLAWDMGKGYELKSLYLSGYTVLGISTIMAIATALM